ncbi:hypothetical protein FHR81_004032 [Actinoalloteichus hoggarensis]|uniref:hypothetical protein n=1 Tax=Actinoalloteichus hoggarensis TaxID=1470176 RepID=UPI0012FE3035|nr:hypothetical protein [Actinoalloteichus hoggarensis]MBB5922965.1 hypothetical protein [Actinoalloteichus hoggarensis]
MSDGYQIDLDRAPQVLANLKRALEALVETRREAQNLTTIAIRGSDDVSKHATAELQRLVVDGNLGSLFVALEAYQRALGELINNLETSLLEYHGQEEINAITPTEFALPEDPTGPAGPNYAI